MNTECINSSAVPSVSSHPCASRAQQHTQAFCPRCSLGFSTWEGCSWISPVNPESLTTFTKNIWHKLEYLKGTSPGRQVSFSVTLQWLLSGAWAGQLVHKGRSLSLDLSSFLGCSIRDALCTAAVPLRRFTALGHPSGQATPHVQ